MAETAITLKRAVMINGKHQEAFTGSGKNKQAVTISVAEAIAKALIKSGSAVAASSSSSRKSTTSSSSASASSTTESSGS